MSRSRRIATRVWATGIAAAAVGALTILALARPALPHLPSLTAPLTSSQVEHAVLCLAWLLAVALTLNGLYQALHAFTRAPTTRSLPLGTTKRAPRRSAVGRTPAAARYVLTIPRPSEGARAFATPETEPASAATATDEPEQVAISLLGALTITGAAIKIRRAATRELIAYLALHPHGATRDELLEAIWPGADPRRTRPRFWQSVTEARKALGAAWLHDGERYQLDREKLQLDLDQLERLLAVSDPRCEAQALEEAAALWRGEPLAGSDYLWADGDRRRLHATLLDLLVRVGHARLAKDDARAALAAAEQAIALDDLHEPSWRLALQAEHALGLRSSVTQRYDRLADTLDQQLGLQPSHETRTMYRRLLGQT